MTSPEAQPVKRAPGRPRKVESDEKPAEKPAQQFPVDERIGLTVSDDRWEAIGFDDGRSYRVENGVIVERVS